MADMGYSTGKDQDDIVRTTNDEDGTMIRGNAGNDSLRGGRYNDILVGGPGDDAMYGGDGADQFRFFGDEIEGPRDRDRIYDLDFSEGDKLVFGDYQDGTFTAGPGENVFSDGSAAIISSWEGLISAINDSSLITAQRAGLGNDNLIVYISNGSQVQEVNITGGYSQYLANGGTEFGTL